MDMAADTATDASGSADVAMTGRYRMRGRIYSEKTTEDHLMLGRWMIYVALSIGQNQANLLLGGKGKGKGGGWTER